MYVGTAVFYFSYFFHGHTHPYTHTQGCCGQQQQLTHTHTQKTHKRKIFARRGGAGEGGQSSQPARGQTLLSKKGAAALLL